MKPKDNDLKIALKRLNDKNDPAISAMAMRKRLRKDPRGGKRKGAGRPPSGVKRKPYLLYLREDSHARAKYMAARDGVTISAVTEKSIECYDNLTKKRIEI